MPILENLKGKLFEKAQNVSLHFGKNKDKEIKLGDAINTVSSVVSKTSEIVNEISDTTNNLASKIADTSPVVNETAYIEEENIENTQTEVLTTQSNEPTYEDNQVMLNQNEIRQTSIQAPELEQGLAASLASQAMNNPVLAQTLAARPDLAIITGFQEVCRLMNNPKYLDTIRGIVNDETDMVKSVSHDVKETTINVSHDARDVALKRSDNFKDVALNRSDNFRDVALKGFDTYQTCYTSTLTTQLEALKSSENFMLSSNIEQNRHEEFMLLQQKEMFEKMLEASTHRFDSKVDFIKNQQQSLDEFYKKDVDLLTEHIQVLEAERNKNMDNTKVYMRLSDDISKLEDSKLEMKREYRKASNQLTDTIKTLEIQMKYELPSHGNNILGTKF